MSNVFSQLVFDAVVVCVRRVMDEFSPEEPDALALVQSPRARHFAEFMLTRFGARLHVKDIPLMRITAAGFDVASFFTTGVPSSSAFLHRYGTTLGTEIFLPAEILAGDPDAFMQMLTHECEHVAQFREEHVAFVWLYASESEARARYEANSYGAGMECRFALHATVLPPESLLGDLVAAYHCRAEDQALALLMMRSLCESASVGVQTTDAGAAAARWLGRNPS